MEGSCTDLGEEEDARLLDRCEAKRKERSKHWQCDEEVQNVEEKHGRIASANGESEMIKSAEGSAVLVSCTRSQSPQYGGAQTLQKEEEDARLLDLCEAKKEEWAKHWSCGENVQNVEDKFWKKEELRKFEEALPRLKEYEWKKVSRLYKAKTGVGCDGFHPKSSPGFAKRGEKSWSYKWPQQACTVMFFLIPKNVTSERPIVVMPTLIRWWEALGAPEVAKWQQKYRVRRY